MIIYSPSLASLHRASPLAAAQYMRSVIGPRDSRRQIGALPRPILSGAGGDAEAALASWLAASPVIDGQLAGACRLGFQGVVSAGAVRTRAGPETRRAPPWTVGAGSQLVSSELKKPVYVYLHHSFFRGVIYFFFPGVCAEKTTLWIPGQDYFFFFSSSAKKRLRLQSPTYKPGVPVNTEGGRRAGWQLSHQPQQLLLRLESAAFFPLRNSFFIPPLFFLLLFFFFFSFLARWIWDFKMWAFIRSQPLYSWEITKC